MATLKKNPIIMMADDDNDYYRLVKEAVWQMGWENELRHVEDGEELLGYLLRRGKYQDPHESPRPGLIFLDLNMPKKNGFQSLEEIRAHPDLREIPVVMLTSSTDRKDILLSYALGANSFVAKPFGYDELVNVLKVLQKYWLETVRLPVS